MVAVLYLPEEDVPIDDQLYEYDNPGCVHVFPKVV